jgi:hypothetical protein
MYYNQTAENDACKFHAEVVFYPEGRANTLLQNVRKLIPDYTVSYPQKTILHICLQKNLISHIHNHLLPFAFKHLSICVLRITKLAFLQKYILGVKQQRCEADQSPPSNAEVKNGGAIFPLPHVPLWHSP